MAVDVCSEISISPRISFSHDLNQTTDSLDTHRRLDSSLLDSDFNFCISSTCVQEQLSSADELFSNGKLLPVELKQHKTGSISTQKTSHPYPVSSHKKQLKEFLSMSIDTDDDDKIKPTSKSFWQFKRSNSLNCDSSTRTNGLIRSFHFLSRSNSTGSAPNQPKLTLFSKEINVKPRLQKQHSVPSRKAPGSSFGSLYGYSGQRNPGLRKCGSYGSGVRVSPVLNITPPYISRGSVGLFGLFCNGKMKGKKR